MLLSRSVVRPTGHRGLHILLDINLGQQRGRNVEQPVWESVGRVSLPDQQFPQPPSGMGRSSHEAAPACQGGCLVRMDCLARCHSS